jgi:DHA3 family macrolide efflux protein-like MFS transporter
MGVGRVSAWIDPLMMLAHSISLGLIAWLFPAYVSLEAIYYGIGIALLIVSVIYFSVLPRLSREAERSASGVGAATNG